MANRSGVRTLVIALVSAAVLVGLLLCAYFLLMRASGEQGITLPEPTQPGTPSDTGSVQEGLFLQVTTENVRDVVALLDRPAAYHQTLTLTTAWSDGSADRTAEIWVSGGVMRVDLTTGGTIRSCLSDGQTAYLWYQDDAVVTSFPLDSDTTLDDLMGIPSYEDLLVAEPDQITDAGYVSLSDLDGRSCVYAQLTGDNGYADSYWIDVSTGLLCRADSLSDGRLIYKLRETAIELPAASDEMFLSAFTLPDGTAPFSSEQ